MTYRVIGIMSGSSLDGLDIAFVEFSESGGKWDFEIKAASCYPYTQFWFNSLKNATTLNAYDYQLLHTSYGKYIGEKINEFINEHNLHHQVQLIATHGHTTFHAPALGMTAQIGDGAAIAAQTEINVVSDLRALDVAFGGQGAPIVPIGEKLLFSNYSMFLNIGGIANITIIDADNLVAFDICAANKVLNMLIQKQGKAYDFNGETAAIGTVHTALLTKLNSQQYYKEKYPKSLSNDFGIETIFPIIESFNLSTEDALRTMVEHIVMQVAYQCQQFKKSNDPQAIMITGGGALNKFLIKRLTETLEALHIEVVIPSEDIINYKEALIMALIGILRWREEYNVLSSATGSRRSSINGAVWMGQEA